ncbi:acetyl-CoA acetyltransferase, cytosolic 1-like protein [Tanacetum coccineum]
MMAKTEEGPCEEEEDAHMGSLRVLNAINVRKESPTVEAKNNKSKRAHTVETKTSTRALVDTGASHNFISVDEAKRLGLETTKDSGWIKAVNGGAKAISGVARGMKTKIGGWEGELDLSVVPIDDYQLVLRMEFFDKLKSGFKVLKQNISDISSDVETSRDTKDVLEDFKGAISSVLPERRAQESCRKGRRRTKRKHPVTRHEQGSNMEEAK